MNRRQQIFVESVLKRDNPEDHAFLEAVLKSYVINEGILDRRKELLEKGKKIAGDVAGKVRRKVGEVAGKVADAMKEPALQPVPEKKVNPDYVAIYRAIKFEPDCWERDYNRFLQNCEVVKYFVATYGRQEYNRIVFGDSFKEAVRIGRQIDSIRKNPAIAEESRRFAFGECIGRFAGDVREELLEAVMHDFYESECESFEVPLMEGMEDNLQSFRNAMAGIETFIRKHGVYPWQKFLTENHMLFARASRSDRADYGKKPESQMPSPSMAAEIMKAYQSGSAES